MRITAADGIIKAIRGIRCLLCFARRAGMSVHVRSDAILSQYGLFSTDIADKTIEYLDKQWLPPGRQENPAPLSTMNLGTAWLEANSVVALVLPSCVIPLENNAILNPHHPGFRKLLKSFKELPFSFDSRLVSQAER